MDFLSFVRAHGILIDTVPPVGRWMRLPTQTHPRKRNGAVKFMGDFGFCQEHSTMTEVAVWRAEGESQAAIERVQQVAQQAAQETERKQREAAAKAAQMLAESELLTHPYMAAKGFPDERVNVLDGVMLVPMRVGRDLVGAQQITAEGGKKFIFGQRSSMAEFVMTAGQDGVHVVCEGYATGLSVRAALATLRRPYYVHVAFSAGNMKKIAQALPSGLAIADNDASETGEKTCKEIGWPYWMSDTVGEDCNDYHQRRGLFALAQGLQKMLLDRRQR